MRWRFRVCRSTVSPTATNSGIVFVTLKSVRSTPRDKSLSAGAIAGALNQKFGAIQDAYIAVFPPPPVMGLGTIGGFRLQLEDRSDRGFDELYKQTQNLIAASHKDPRWPACSPASRSPCRRWTPTSIAKRPRPRA